MKKRETPNDLKQRAVCASRQRPPSVFLVGLLMLLSAFTLQAQNARHAVNGLVTSVGGEPLIGVNVLVKGTTSGTVTDIDGRFKIDAADNDVLQFSYTGFLAQEIAVGSRTNLEVQLEENIAQLDEVVVVGYGTQKKSDLTGAVSSISGERLLETITTNVDQALQGRIAGVQVTQNSGQPGGAVSIRIRGTNSITGSNEPLYVIDGVPIQGDGQSISGFDWSGGANGQNRVNPLSTINPNDIARIEVLKDASATAIYGSRAANGVVLITTKRGEAGKAKISYNGYYAVQHVPKEIDMMNLREFAAYRLQVADDLNQQPDQRYMDPSILGEGTNWQEELFDPAPMQSHQMSISGGTDKSQYAVTGSYLTQDGIVIGSNFQRFTTRLNLDTEVNDWFRLGSRITFASTDEVITLNDGGDGVIFGSLMMSPDVPVRDFDGNFAGPPADSWGTQANPIGTALLRNNGLKRQKILANFYGEAQILKGLSLRSEFGFDNNNSINKAFLPTYKWGSIENTESQFRQREESNFFWIWKNYLTYNLKSGNAHDLTVLLGSEIQKSQYEGITVTKRRFATNDIQVLNQGETANTLTDGWKGASSLASYYARLNYILNEKYLATFTLRADGSSKFGANNRWALFPSGSVGWRISEEGFLQDQELISDLKLRVGYGQTGNQAIPDFLYASTLVTNNTALGTIYRNEKYSNPDLKWETTEQYNVGVDFGLFDGRLSITADYYQKKTRDLLLQVDLPFYLGGPDWWDVQAPYANIGTLENKGFELGLNTVNIDQPNFEWRTNFTFTRNRNKVLELNATGSRLEENLYWYSEFQTATITQAGLPVGQFYGYVTDGIFENEQDILNHAVQVLAPGSVNSENPNGQNLVDKRDGVWIGDVKFKDLNGDGVINIDDQQVIGDPNPDFTFGLNNAFKFGPVSLDVYLTGSKGAQILNYTRVVIEGMTSPFSNQSRVVNDRAQYQLLDPNGSDLDPANVVLANPGTDVPRWATNDNNRNNRASDRWVEDGSYLRIQNIRLGFTLPKLYTPSFVRNLQIYANVQNLKTFTKYSGYDPEIGAFNQNSLLQNVDMGRYPSPTLYTFGLNLDF